MRVTMLGISGAGKTTYMAGLAQKMANNIVSGYTLTPYAADPKDAALMRAEFSKLTLATSGKFPNGTMTTTKWTFNLQKSGDKVCFFEWIDFRGGYLDQLQEGINDSSKIEIAELLAYVEASDAVIIFVDAVRAFLYRDQREAALHLTKAQVIFQFLIDVSRKYPDRTFIIVGTKADSDLIDREYQEDNFTKLIELLDKLFREHYTPLLDSGWKGAITCAGAIGIGGVASQKTDAESIFEAPKVSTKITKFPIPANVETPLLYCLLQELRRNASRGANSIIETQLEINRMEAESGLVNLVLSKLAQTKSAKERAIELASILQAERELLRRFVPSIPDLEKIIRHKIKVLST